MKPRRPPFRHPKRGQDHPGEDPDRQLIQWWLSNRGTLDDAIDHDVERSCSRKDAYESAEAARAVAAMNGMADVLFTYECRYCRSWHLTRRPTR